MDRMAKATKRGFKAGNFNSVVHSDLECLLDVTPAVLKKRMNSLRKALYNGYTDEKGYREMLKAVARNTSTGRNNLNLIGTITGYLTNQTSYMEQLSGLTDLDSILKDLEGKVGMDDYRRIGDIVSTVRYFAEVFENPNYLELHNFRTDIHYSSKVLDLTAEGDEGDFELAVSTVYVMLTAIML